jgi:hypothetical protein
MRIDVLDPRTSERVFTCDGPDPYGGCRRAGDDGDLPCAGLALQPVTAAGRLGTFRFTVSGHGPSCPLRCLS